VVDVGLRVGDAKRSWKLNDGAASVPLPVSLNDGEVVTMSWMPVELGEAFHNGEIATVACYAVDGRGREVRGKAP
jgi:hypothetical protein